MDAIQTIYIALFGRPADPLGLEYFMDETNDGADLTAIGDLAATDEYQSRFEGMSNQQIITAIYQSLFGRNPEAAGLSYFLAELTSGRQNINTIAINIAQGAQGDDLATLENKIVAANAFTAAIDTPDELAAYQGDDAADAGRAFLSPITADETTIPDAAATDQALLDIVNGNVTPGEPVNFTSAVGEALVGTTGNDTFSGVVGTDGTVNVGDTVNGLAGQDTLNLLAATGAAGLPAGFTSSNIEIVNVNYAGGNLGAALTSASFGGVEQLWQINDAVAVTVGAGVTAGFRTTAVAAADTVTAADGVTSVDVALDRVTTGAVVGIVETTGADVTTVSVTGSVAGAGALTVNTATGTTAVDTIELALTSSGTITVTGDALVVTTLDASASTGNLNITLGGTYTALETFNLGSGNDRTVVYQDGTADLAINLGAGDDYIEFHPHGTNANATVDITLGAGADTLYLTDVYNVKVATAAAFQNEAVKVTDFSAAEDVLDVSGIGTLSTQNTVNGALVGAGSLFEAIGAVAAAQDNTVAQFVFGGNLYIYNGIDNSGTFNAGDGLVELTGVTSLLTAGTNLIV